MPLLVFLPVAVLCAAIDGVFLASGGRFVAVPEITVHLLLWAPTLLLAAGAILSWRGRSIRWVLLLLSAFSPVIGFGIAAENWPVWAAGSWVLLWVGALVSAPAIAWALQRRVPARRSGRSMTPALVPLVALVLACASAVTSSPLDRIYRLGTERAAAAKKTLRQENDLAYTRLRDAVTGELGLSAAMKEALASKLPGAVGYDAYHVRVKQGHGYYATWKRYCDFVFFSESQEIVTSYRREGGC